MPKLSPRSPMASGLKSDSHSIVVRNLSTSRPFSVAISCASSRGLDSCTNSSLRGSWGIVERAVSANPNQQTAIRSVIYKVRKIS